VSFEFLEPDRASPELGFEPVPASILLPQALAAGARVEVRDGWQVAVEYGSVDAEREASRATVGICDVSWIGKLELQGRATDVAAVAAGGGAEGIELGGALRSAEAWWCPFSERRVLAVCEPPRARELRETLLEAAAKRATTVTDMTCALAALVLVGPLARDVLARLTAIDLRSERMPEASFRPGSVARVPGMLLRERGDRYVLMFGSAYAQYMWTQVTDAAEPLGGMIVGTDALAESREEVAAVA
jgi:heterotetrameric sarcosine oxidase gamma subunit